MEFPLLEFAIKQQQLSPLECANLACDPRSQVHVLGSDKHCLDKLLMSHNYSHIYPGDVAHFAYVCLNMEQSVSEIVETVVYPIGNPVTCDTCPAACNAACVQGWPCP